MEICTTVEDDEVSGGFVELLNNNSTETSLLNLRHEYEKRLVTFQASTYYAKPPCLSPLFCARFGWENADKDILVCTSCSSVLAITLNSKLSAKTYDKLCQAYRNKIVSCHAPSCPFRLSSIEELESLEAAEKKHDIVETADGYTDLEQTRLTVPVYMSQVLPEESIRLMEHPRPSTILRQNAKKLSDAIRSISCAANAKNNLDGASFSTWSLPRLQIPSKIRQMNSSLELTKMLDCDSESILALALLGWTPIPNVSLDSSAPIVSFGCPCSLSIMDIRLVQGSTEVSDENETDRVNKRQRVSSRSLNPLDAHRHYSPYKVGFPEKAGHTKPLWKTILMRLCDENKNGRVQESASSEEISTETDARLLDDPVINVRKILRAGIATR